MKKLDEDIVTEQPVSLQKFIKDQKDLISIAGVFVALTLFTNELVPGLLGGIISLLFFGGFLLLWAELWSSFPCEETTLRLALFEEAIVYSGFALMLYWYLKLKLFSSMLFVWAVALPLAAVITSFISRVIKKSKIFKRLKISNGSLICFITGTGITFAVLIPVVILIQYAISQYDNSFDDAVEEIFSIESISDVLDQD